MFKETQLTNEQSVNLVRALKKIQEAEQDRKTEDGRTTIEVISLPPKTAYKISRQLRKLDGVLDDYNDFIKRAQEKANEEGRKEKTGEGKWPVEIFEEMVKSHNDELDSFEILETPLRYSSDPEKSDFGKVTLKSDVLTIIPEGIIEWIE